MCYQEGKNRFYNLKPKSNCSQLRLKENKNKKDNDKDPLDHRRSKLQEEDRITSNQERNKQANNKIHVYPTNQERHIYQISSNNLQSKSNKPLTFGNVKNKPKEKEEATLQESTMTINPPQVKKPLQPSKIVNQLEKGKFNLTDRHEKLPIDNKQKIQKNNFLSKNRELASKEDLCCGEELQFRPVLKKSLIPEKKYLSDKSSPKFDFTKPITKQKRNDMKQLKNFESLQQAANMHNEGEILSLTCFQQEQYLVSADYLEKNQKNINWWSRAIVVNWMRHICYEFGLQRDTYHIAVVLLDNYLAKSSHIAKSALQAIAATTLFLSSKLQEFQCRESRQFVQSTNNSCSVQDIHELQIKIVKSLRFRLNPPTLYTLANKILSQWDIFLQKNQKACVHPIFQSSSRIFFKQLDENSYRLFRELMQLIDCSVMDVQTGQYKPKMLLCSFMYLLIGREMGIFKNQQIVTEFPGSSLYLLNQSNNFNDLYGIFVELIFGFSLFDMLPAVQYAATYFQLPFTYEKPILSNQTDLESMSLEEYCSYQTFNAGMLKTMKHRYRGLFRLQLLSTTMMNYQQWFQRSTVITFTHV